jgi:hypothetical protein
MGLSGWGSAKDVILRELAGARGKRQIGSGKGEAGEDKLTVESLELKEREREKDNAETQNAQRFRREDGVAGTGWRLTNTANVTIYANTLSSVYWNAIQIICGKLRKSQKPHTQVKTRTRRTGGCGTRHPGVSVSGTCASGLQNDLLFICGSYGLIKPVKSFVLIRLEVNYV